MRFLHAADVHIGKRFASVGEKGDELRKAQVETVSTIADLAETEGVDCLIIAGDLFDSNEVTGRTVRKVVNILKGINPIPVLISPGTHDLLDEGSVYRKSEFAEAENIKVFGIDGVTITVGDTAVHGRANDTKQGGVRPLVELQPSPDATSNVAVIHASVEIEGKYSPHDYLVSFEEIASSGMDYIAMGHWHKMAEYSSGGVQAWYSGAPEITKFDEADGAGYVRIVEVSGGKVTARSEYVSRFRWREESIDVSACPPGGPLESEIESLGGDDVLLRVRLKGVLGKGMEVVTDDLEEDLAEGFFHLEIDAGDVGYPVEEVENLFADGTIGSLYIARFKGLVEEAETDEERSLLEEALYRGASYISGDLEVN